MQTNTRRKGQTARTHEGAVARKDDPVLHLKQVLNAHMLWEDSFYIDGQDAAGVLAFAVRNAAARDPFETGNAIIDARTFMNMRHAPLFAAAVYAAIGGPDARDLVRLVVQRADEMAEIIVMAKGLTESGKLPSAVKKGVADAFPRFDEYQLGKYKGASHQVSLKDVVRIVHPESPLAKKVVDETLEVPNTWETRLSAGEDKKEVFTDLLKTSKLGAMALLRNLRNMGEVGVPRDMIRAALNEADWSRVLPFRFMTAAITCPTFAPELDRAFRDAVKHSPYLPGATAVMVDTSGSMHAPISRNSVVMRHWAGAVLAAAINGDRVDTFEWATGTRQLPRFGGLGDALQMETGRVGHGTDARQAMDFVSRAGKYDRFILISDMQFGRFAAVPDLPEGAVGYTINLAAYENRGMMRGQWTHLSGFSDKVLNWIATEEA